MVCPICGLSPGGPFSWDQGEVRLVFDSGNVYDVSRTILHFVDEHGYKPPGVFVGDVMNSRCVSEEITRVAFGRKLRIGFLTSQDSFEVGYLPAAFLPRLAALMKEAVAT